jgi:hypothetical protein
MYRKERVWLRHSLREMKWKGSRKPSSTPEEGFEEFGEWLGELRHNTGKEPVVVLEATGCIFYDLYSSTALRVLHQYLSGVTITEETIRGTVQRSHGQTWVREKLENSRALLQLNGIVWHKQKLCTACKACCLHSKSNWGTWNSRLRKRSL